MPKTVRVKMKSKPRPKLNSEKDFDMSYNGNMGKKRMSHKAMASKAFKNAY